MNNQNIIKQSRVQTYCNEVMQNADELLIRRATKHLKKMDSIDAVEK